jgi:hypothetical protein
MPSTQSISLSVAPIRTFSAHRPAGFAKPGYCQSGNIAGGEEKMMKPVVLSICLAATSFSLQPQRAWSVDIAPARKHLIPTADLPIYCRSAVAIEGCTEFLGEVLHCECGRHGAGWSIAARASLVPYMYVTRPAVEQHEQLHFDDLREQIGTYLAELTARSFTDRESCVSSAEFETTVFNLRMDLFCRLSNRRLH